MKQSKKFNKCIKRAIEAAKQERKKLIEYRDTWERAIQEKNRQLETLNNMLTAEKLFASAEVKECKEMAFDIIWGEFNSTLTESVKKRTTLMNDALEWCKMFYSYEVLNIDDLSLKYHATRDQIEEFIFVPFLKFLNIKQLKIDSEVVDIVALDLIKIASSNKYLIVEDDDHETFQRIRPTN